MQQAFSMIPLPAERSQTKPRRSGLTMMMDWGIPIGKQQDLLELVAPCVDLAKLVVGTARLYDEQYLARKIENYLTHQIDPFIGGQFLEYIMATQGFAGVRQFCEEARRLGIGAIEVSDNLVPLTGNELRDIIKTAIDCGLQVHGEVGSKADISPAGQLVQQATDYFDAGAQVVLVEAAELMEGGTPNRLLIESLASELDIARVLFELPGPWIQGTTLTEVLYLKKFLIDQFGPDVNIANVMPDDIFETEAMRVNLSFNGPGRHAT